MYLGLNLSHDASASLISLDGRIVSALQEERISRIKNHIGIPIESIKRLLENKVEIKEIIIGTHQEMTKGDALRFLVGFENNPSNKQGYWSDLYPGFASKNVFSDQNGNAIIEKILRNEFKELNLELPEITWVQHHRAHLGCALGIAPNSEKLLFSLDGEGDGQSGAVAHINKGKMNLLSTFPKLDSLGNLYSAVTGRYNFKPGKHEGKITGLAAFGAYSNAVDVLLDYVTIQEGIPKIAISRNLKAKIIQKIRKEIGIAHKSARTLDEIVMLAESETQNYADLAFAIQVVLEKSVCEIIDFWRETTGVSEIALAGGVFANVKLNQRLAELDKVTKVSVFPNMGDGGLAMGGVWATLFERGELLPDILFENMYLAPETKDFDFNSLKQISKDSKFRLEYMSENEIVKSCVASLLEGLSVAVHRGKMEFGPRALGNRSLLADPRDRFAVERINKKLKRTEFMPFAPMVLIEDAEKYFKLPMHRQPFEYMTMTCEVREEFRESIPAVTHIDGTARPQVVTEKQNTFIYNVLKAFKEETGIGILINTSLNIHEEPINYSLNDTAKALENFAIDVIYGDGYRISLT